MNITLAALAACGGAIAYWIIAAMAAHRRRLIIGPLPPALLALVAAGSAVAAMSGAHMVEILALAGVIVGGWVDARTGFIFDPITAMLLAASFGLRLIDGAALAGTYGAVAIGASLTLLYTATGGRGLGLGDVKFGAAAAMALGVVSGFVAIGIAFVLGAAFAVALLATKRATRASAIRFGPFIAAGTFAAVILPRALLP